MDQFIFITLLNEIFLVEFSLILVEKIS